MGPRDVVASRPGRGGVMPAGARSEVPAQVGLTARLGGVKGLASSTLARAASDRKTLEMDSRA